MRKSILILALAFGTTFAFAQDLTSKKGEQFLPKAKDWAISIDGKPFLTLLSVGPNPTANFLTQDQTIAFKYFKDDQTAFRAKLRIGFSSLSEKALVPDATSTDPTKTVEDKKTTSGMNIVLGGGIEKRKGSTRLQGIYGAEALISMVSGSRTYDYGNALTKDNTSNAPQFGQSQGVTKETDGFKFGFGARAFIGAEYFVLPKMSIGVEYGWGLMFSSQSNDKTETQYWGVPQGAAAGTASSVQTQTTEKGGKSSFGLDTDLSNAAIFLTLHF
ncbi:MAG: hypothetical protein Q8880_02255 [Bacteroidota bacterium]|nr:hypothetical protein [Bacteroidota bacterium]